MEEGLDFGLEEGGAHDGEEGFKIVFYEVHHDEDSEDSARERLSKASRV